MTTTQTTIQGSAAQRDAAIVARLQALAEAHTLPGTDAVHKAVEWHNAHSERPAYFARIAYLSALSFAAILKHIPLPELEERSYAAVCEHDPRYRRNYDLLARLVEKGCERRGELTPDAQEGSHP